MTSQDGRTGVTFNSVSRKPGTTMILIDFDTFRDRLALSLAWDEAERLRDALIEKCAGQKPAQKRNFCPECGSRCQFCPECGERLK